MQRPVYATLRRLQRNTLIRTQLVGYALSLVVGTAIVLIGLQAFVDIRPALSNQTDVFGSHTVTLSKELGALQSVNKKGIYFSKAEMEALVTQPFVSDVAGFSSASFHTAASVSVGGQGFYTDLFFESVPDRYVDVKTDLWQWDSSSAFLPVVIPEDYLNLYNFGFAESQSLPVVSQSALERVSFSIHVSGHGRQATYTSRIVGFSSKLNTILVPESFLVWANSVYGSGNERPVSRLLVELSDPTDERIPDFLQQHGYHVNQAELQSGRLMFFFRLVLAFVVVVASLIILLSVAFLTMGMQVVVQRNRTLFVNLYNIGYTPRQMVCYYRRVVGAVTVGAVALAALLAAGVWLYCVQRLSAFFTVTTRWYPLVICDVVLALLLVVVHRRMLLRGIISMVEPKG